MSERKSYVGLTAVIKLLLFLFLFSIVSCGDDPNLSDKTKEYEIKVIISSPIERVFSGEDSIYFSADVIKSIGDSHNYYNNIDAEVEWISSRDGLLMSSVIDEKTEGYISSLSSGEHQIYVNLNTGSGESISDTINIYYNATDFELEDVTGEGVIIHLNGENDTHMDSIKFIRREYPMRNPAYNRSFTHIPDNNSDTIFVDTTITRAGGYTYSFEIFLASGIVLESETKVVTVDTVTTFSYYHSPDNSEILWNVNQDGLFDNKHICYTRDSSYNYAINFQNVDDETDLQQIEIPSLYGIYVEQLIIKDGVAFLLSELGNSYRLDRYDIASKSFIDSTELNTYSLLEGLNINVISKDSILYGNYHDLKLLNYSKGMTDTLNLDTIANSVVVDLGVFTFTSSLDTIFIETKTSKVSGEYLYSYDVNKKSVLNEVKIDYTSNFIKLVNNMLFRGNSIYAKDLSLIHSFDHQIKVVSTDGTYIISDKHVINVNTLDTTYTVFQFEPSYRQTYFSADNTKLFHQAKDSIIEVNIKQEKLHIEL